MKPKPELVTIVIAWVENTGMEPAGHDPYTHKARFNVVPEAKACVWLRAGKPGDIDKAKAYAATEPGRQVFTMPMKEKDPLGVGKRLALEAVANGTAIMSP